MTRRGGDIIKEIFKLGTGKNNCKSVKSSEIVIAVSLLSRQVASDRRQENVIVGIVGKGGFNDQKRGV